jgi:hypothetical protein
MGVEQHTHAHGTSFAGERAMGYVIEDRMLAARTRYQIRLFRRQLAKAGASPDVLAAAEMAAAPMLDLLSALVEDDVHPE